MEATAGGDDDTEMNATEDGPEKTRTGAETEVSEETKNEEEEEGMATDVENSEEDEAAEAEYAACRPIAPFMSTAKPSANGASNSKTAVGSHCRIFYGNESLFVMLKLFEILFKRMESARICAAAQNGDKDSPDAKAMHEKFMKMAESLIEGNTDPSTYEDDCRSLLGTNSYRLFTLDKLVQKLVRHALTCLSEDQTHRLIDLWKYENSRTIPIVDSVYYANARVITGDEPTVRFESVAGADGTGKELTYQYLEGEKSEVPSVVDARFRGYVDHYVAPDEEGKVAGVSYYGEDDEEAEERDAVPVCLRRNLEREGVKEGADADALASKAIKQAFIVRNGLECKLGTTPARKTKKIAYVLGTEDVMFRTKRPASSKAGAAGKAKKGKKSSE